MLFRVPVPGFGSFFVDAPATSNAVSAVQMFLNRNGIRLEEGAAVGRAIPASGSESAGATVLDSNGFPVEEAAILEEPVPSPSPAVSETLISSRRASTFVGKVVDESGNVRFFRVESPDTDQARSILVSNLGPTANVQIVSSPDFLLANDSDFRSAVQQSGASDVELFVSSLQQVFSRPVEPGPDLGEDFVVSPDNPADQAVVNLPVDVQDFPFASFQNAVAELGLDPEGALGSTISQRFNALAPAAQIGSLTGTVDPIGQSPGALESFFRDRFGDLDIAAETFSDLLAGATANDADAGALLALQALQNPDIGTSRGRGDAADVFRLARAAAADRFGSFVASRLLPSNARLFRELERQLAQGDPSTDFLQFARDQNLLPA